MHVKSPETVVRRFGRAEVYEAGFHNHPVSLVQVPHEVYDAAFI